VVDVYRESFFAGLTPDPDMTVSQWSDEFRMLSQKASAEPGRWRTDRTPYLREILDSLSPSDPTQRVVFMAGAQVGKTETGNNWIGFIVDMAPGPLMLVQPTVDMAKRLSKQRLAPMIEETPRLKDKIADARSRDSNNTMMAKEFPGGFMLITGANSAVGLRSMPVRYLFLDEIDGYPSDLDGEGDPVNLAERRTTTFARRKVYMCSTPTIKDQSRIEREYDNSDRRKFFVPCPDCGHFQELVWKNIKWTDNDPATVKYLCASCGVLIDEHHKTDMLLRGEWRPTALGDGKTRGYHLSSLYSPLGWKSWSEIVEEFLKAKSDPPLLKTFINTILAETWQDEIAAKVGAGELQERMENYQAGTAPAGVLSIVAGVDTQDNRFAVSIIGFGRDEESWVLRHDEIFGDPAKPEIWAQLANILRQPIEHEVFEPMNIMATCIDSGGHFTHEVYGFAREHRDLNVMAVKGQSQKNKSIMGRPTRVDLNLKRQILKNGAEVWPVGTDTAKATIYARLKLTEPGAGFVHFHDQLTEEYFRQLTAEKLQTRYVKGFPVREWVKKWGERNEALDTFVYALAAQQSLYFRFNRKTVWDQMENRHTLKETAPIEVKQRVLQRPVKRNIVRSSSSFVTSW
jgi:phage terminase large subunit GpA-like protein